jgi:four helix bundle protein
VTPAVMNDRLLRFGASVMKLVNGLPQTFAGRHIGGQLLRSATSIGANYEEAQGAESKADFTHKIQIALKECRETNYWLRIMSESELTSSQHLQELVDESLQLRAILSKSVATLKSKNDSSCRQI